MSRPRCSICGSRPAEVEACCGASIHGECPCWDYDNEHPAGGPVCRRCYGSRGLGRGFDERAHFKTEV